MNSQEWPIYRYRATVTRVHDGDTFWAMLSQGVNVYTEIMVRVFGDNAPELFGVEKPEGIIARDWLTRELLGKPIWIRTIRDTTSFARYLGEVWYDPDADGTLKNLATVMIAAGLAVPTDAQGHDLEPAETRSTP